MARTRVWLERSLLLAAHDEQLVDHGGASGLRDEGLFDSALARPLNLASSAQPDVADLAASYGFGLAKNHAFVDGNKRIAFIAVELFLDLNGFELTASDADCVLTMLSVAAGELDENGFSAWLRRSAKAH